MKTKSPAVHTKAQLMKWTDRCCAQAIVLTVALSNFLSPTFARAQKAAPPSYRYHKAEAEYRAMFMRDEKGEIPPNALLNALGQKQKMKFDPQAWPGVVENLDSTHLETAGIGTNTWVWLGPGNIGGRVRSIIIHPTNPSTMWVGGVGGGVWKTVNSGTTWFPLNDFMANLAICSMVMDPTDANVIYVGTGEGFSNFDALRGAGIFKTTNGGTNWTQLPSTANSSFYNVNRLSVCATNHLIILAATGTGIWRSTDGGTNWSQRYSAAAILDIDFHPTDGGKAVASGSTFGVTGRALYSNDGGVTWLTAAGVSTAGRIEIAYAPSSPNIVYASCNNNSGEVYGSTDGGATFTLKNTGSGYLGGQGWYDNALWVDPTNPNILIVGGVDLWRSSNGGTNLTRISQWQSAPNSAHADHHCIVNHPSFNGGANTTVFFGDDGGVYRAANVYTVSLTSGWQELNNNLGITQYYGAAGNPNSGRIIGGTQDNGTLRYTPASGTEAWTAMFGGDGGFCASDPTDPNYFYGEYVYLQIHRSSNGGSSSSYIFSGIGDAGVPGGGEGDPDAGGPDGDPEAQANFIAPFILDPNNANTMLAGGSNLWRSVNVKVATPTWTNIKGGTNTTSFINAIAVAPGNSDIIWVGHNNGDVYATVNGTAASPDWVRKDLGAPNLPNRTCSRITFDLNDPNRVYVTFTGFNSDNVWRTTDGGITWANISAGLPSVPVRSIVVAPFNTNYLYIGTEIGVFASANGGASWSPGNEGAANASVNELFWMGNTLVETTHARGLFQILVSDKPIINVKSATLIAENCPPGNGRIDPGETVMFQFTLANITSVPTTNVIATLIATNGVTSPSEPQSFGALIGGTTPTSRAFTFNASGSCGGTIIPTIQLQDGTNDLGTLSAVLPLGSQTVLWSENFDSVSPPALPIGWSATFGGAGSAWATSSLLRDTLPNSVFAPDPTNPSTNWLTSPAITVAASTAQLTFRHSYDTESTFDGAALEISIAGGAFTDIVTAGGTFVANGYTDTISTCCQNPLGGRQAWSGNSGGFITSIVSLPAAALGQSVRFRWVFGADTGTGAGGWYVDSIALVGDATCCSGAYVSADVAVGQTVTPSPVNLGSNITFTTLVTNLGLNIATGIVVTDALPSTLSFLSASASQGVWSNDSGVVTFGVGSMSNNGIASLSIIAKVLTNLTITNFSGVASAGTTDPVSGNNVSFFVVPVNVPPVISSIPNVVTNEDNSTLAIPFVIGDLESPATALTVSGISSNTALLPNANIVFGGSGSNRTVTLIPATNANGSATVVISVSDGVGIASTSFLFTVNPVDDAPILAAIPNYTITEGTLLTFTNSVFDPDVPPKTLTFTLSNAPAGAAISSVTRVFTWTPAESQGPGTNQITVIVTDNGTIPLSDSKTFTVVVNESNSPPVLPAQANRTINGVATLTVTNTATDPDIPQNPVSYLLLNAPTNASISSNGIISWTPSVQQVVSTNLFRTVATDSNPIAINTQQLSATNSFTVTVNAVHNGPTLPAQSDRIVTELSQLIVTNTATANDIPALSLTYQLVSPPVGAVINTNGIITWTPSVGQGPATNTITTLVSDNGSPSLSASNSFAVTVYPRLQITSVSATNNSVTIGWRAIAGRIYRLQYVDTISSTNWNDLTPDITASGSPATGSDSTANVPLRFYRVVLLP